MWEKSSNKNLKGQVAIISGSARGIGAACAYTLAREGASIVLVDLLSTEHTAMKLKHDFPSIEVVSERIDIRNREEVQGVIERTMDKWGHLEIIVNNAGTASRKSLEDLNDDEWYLDIDTNLRGTFLFTQLAIYPHMKKQGYGKIINISSISGIIGGLTSNTSGSVGTGRSGPSYAASKGGIIAFTKWVAKDVGELGIYCNSIAPGSVQTEMTKGANYPLDNQPIKRMGYPEDIAETVAFLASPASNYITGQVLRVCGGSAIG